MQSIYHNQDEIVEITYNGSSVYHKSSGPDYTEPFYVENISNSNETLNIKKSSANAPALTIEYLDNTTWTTLCTTSTTAFTKTLQPGAKLYLRCNTNAWASGGYDYNSITGISKIGGNIMSLIYGNEFTGEEKNFKTGTQRVLQGLCYGNNKLKSANFLLLPAETLVARCYQNMFYNCSVLEDLPALTAATLANNCYRGMFSGCTSLTTTPALPATTLAETCYGEMFKNCASLTTTPVLPATTLTPSCYNTMFSGCTSLTTAPVLPATTLTELCYSDMFYGCTSLATAPALPATTLDQQCYSNMFSGCTSLTTAPVLPATTLTKLCYSYMFFGCTSLNNVKCLATDISAYGATELWLFNVSATGTFTKAAGVTWTTGNDGIPSGWTVIEATE